MPCSGRPFFVHLAKSAFSGCEEETRHPEPEVPEEADDEFKKDIDYHTIFGKKLKRGMRCLVDPDWRARILILNVCIEPLRILCKFWLKHSHDTINEPKREYSPATNIMNPQASIVVAVLQYVSTLLHDPMQGDRFRILFVSRGCSDFWDWASKFPQDIELVQKTLFSIHSSIHRRTYYYLCEELGILRVGDLRVPAEMRRTTAMSLCQKRSCCLPPGLPRHFVGKAYERAQKQCAQEAGAFGGDDAMLPKASAEAACRELLSFAFVLFCGSWFLKLSIAIIERLHALNRHIIASGASDVRTFTALSFLDRVVKRHKNRIGPSRSCA